MSFKTFILYFLLVIGISCSTPTHQPITPRFNHVMLYVSDLEASINFYTKAFDLRVTNRLDTLIRWDAEGKEVVRTVNMAFLKFPHQDFVFELSEQKLDSANMPIAFLLQHVGVDVIDIDAAFKRALDAGAKELSPIRSVKATGIEAKQAFFCRT